MVATIPVVAEMADTASVKKKNHRVMQDTRPTTRFSNLESTIRFPKIHANGSDINRIAPRNSKLVKTKMPSKASGDSVQPAAASKMVPIAVKFHVMAGMNSIFDVGTGIGKPARCMPSK